MALAHVPGRRNLLRNVAQELLILVSLAVALGAIGWLVGGLAGLLMMLLVVLVVGAFRPRVPVAWVLSMYQAQPLPRWVAPQFHEIVDVLAVRAGLRRRPSVFYVASPLANAFVVGGQDDAALVVTDGLLQRLNARQLAGVVAHELSHLRNGDTSTMNLSDAVARLAQWMGAVGFWSIMLTVPLAIVRGSWVPVMFSLVLVVLPMVGTLMQLALSRSREYEADLDAVALTGDPAALARALLILESIDGRIWERILVGRSTGPDPLLLQTHPRTEQRVRRLQALDTVPTAGTPHRIALPSDEPPPTAPRRVWWW